MQNTLREFKNRTESNNTSSAIELKETLATAQAMLAAAQNLKYSTRTRSLYP